MGPFPQLSPEFVVRAQPELVMASSRTWPRCRCARAGQLRALQSGARCGFAPAPYDALMRAGPRLAEAAEGLADCLQALDGKVLP
jgi:iron complex transport system substrate-binding protein